MSFFIIASLLGFISVSAVSVNPFVGILLLFTFQPIIAASWNSTFAGINALQLVGTMFPIVMIARMFLTADYGGKRLHLLVVWLLYIFVTLISTASIVAKSNYIEAIENFIKIFNGFIGFYLLIPYFDNFKRLKKLTISLILAGLFPMIIGIYQAVTGKIWYERMTVGLMRNVGLYHDAFAPKFIMFQTIAGILLYWHYFSNKKIVNKLILFIYLILCTVVLFKLYSKSAYLSFSIWTISWAILNKKYIHLLVVLTLLIGANIALDNTAFNLVDTVFSKETSAWEGTGDQKYILAGRLGIWENYLSAWLNSGIVGITFGMGTAGGRAHNDFMRVLVSGGVVGISVYVVLILSIAFKLLKTIWGRFTGLHTIGVMLFLMWFVDAIGTTPGIYPSYQWFVWGIIGLIISGVDGFGENDKNISTT